MNLKGHTLSKRSQFQKAISTWYSGKGNTIEMEADRRLPGVGGRRVWLPRGSKVSPTRAMELFSILIVAVVTPIYRWVKTQRTLHPIKFNFTLCKQKQNNLAEWESISPSIHTDIIFKQLASTISGSPYKTPRMYDYWLSLEPRSDWTWKN